jgi:hypothetical protein
MSHRECRSRRERDGPSRTWVLGVCRRSSVCGGGRCKVGKRPLAVDNNVASEVVSLLSGLGGLLGSDDDVHGIL